MRRRRFFPMSGHDGGEGGIRTREKRLASTRFPVAPVRPLRHLSNGYYIEAARRVSTAFLEKQCFCRRGWTGGHF